MEATVYNQMGKATGKVSLSKDIFGLPWNADLVHEVVRLMNSNSRTNVAHTKTRGEVRGGGRKPYRQKGTGRARQGHRTAPHFRGGGAVFGPHP
ncbi:MAG: large subunit ribosomal protein, partial [Candidatus Parcubacteria bacterium]|nr:large subunit ribosomal protein [Candidatus Parcubacteria bacterium]